MAHLLDSNRKIIYNRTQLAERLPDLLRPLVFTNGCFDILHRGHVDYLSRSAALGRFLLVAVNDDASTRRLNKGKNRPFNSLDDRIAVLASLECIDCVVPFHEDTPLDLIRLVRPDHLVKGGDWPIKQIIGGEFVSQLGGQVHSVPFRYPHSTSKIIRQIGKIEAGG
jgi:rfaE bifunctional protein nucleotidyltransferase chain/domain